MVDEEKQHQNTIKIAISDVYQLSIKLTNGSIAYHLI